MGNIFRISRGWRPQRSSATERSPERFLHERFGRGAVDLRALRAGDVIAFVQRQTKCLQPPALKCVVTAHALVPALRAVSR